MAVYNHATEALATKMAETVIAYALSLAGAPGQETWVLLQTGVSSVDRKCSTECDLRSAPGEILVQSLALTDQADVSSVPCPRVDAMKPYAL